MRDSSVRPSLRRRSPATDRASTASCRSARWLSGCSRLPHCLRVRRPAAASRRSVGRAARSRRGLVAVWAGATIGWSIAPDRSWDTFNRTVVYAVFLGLGVTLAGRAGSGRAPRCVVLAVVIGVVLAWALAREGRFPLSTPPASGSRGSASRSILERARAHRRHRAAARRSGSALLAAREASGSVLGGLLVYVAVLVLLLTLSRAGAVVAIGVVLLWLAALERARARTGSCSPPPGSRRARRRLGVHPPGARRRRCARTPIALRTERCSASSRSSAHSSSRRSSGSATAGALGAPAPACRRRCSSWSRSLLVVGVVALAVAIRNPVSWFRDDVTGSSCSEVVNDPSRFGSLDLNNRWCWWNEATDVFAQHSPPARAQARSRSRASATGRTSAACSEPHSVPLQHLADGGVVGAPVLPRARRRGGAGLRVRGASARGRRARGRGRARRGARRVPRACARRLQLGLPRGDGADDGRARRARRRRRDRVRARRRPLVAVARGARRARRARVVRVAAARRASVRSSTRALDDGDFGARATGAPGALLQPAVGRAALRARPRSPSVADAWRRAQRRYIEAVELQPENPDTWYTLGLFEFHALGNMCAAYRTSNDAYTLDPSGNQWMKGGPLDIAREPSTRAPAGRRGDAGRSSSAPRMKTSARRGAGRRDPVERRRRSSRRGPCRGACPRRRSPAGT